MNYRKFPGTDVEASVLGYGCMRLPVTNEENHPIDREEAIRLIRYAIDNGVKYVDTAYGYHNEQSEGLVGEALKDGYREKVTLTTKLPLWKVETYEDMEKLLDTQLSRLGVDYVDFYLLHAVNAASFDKVVGLGVFDFLDKMIEKGKIRYPSFSFHDDFETFKRVIDSYPFKLAQVQMNVLDEFNQATMKGIEYAASKGIGIVVMEPLRGGALTKNVPDEIKALYDSFEVKRSPAEWAFRYLYNRPEIITILSGMSAVEQVENNIRIFENAEAGCLSETEKELLTNVRKAYEARVRVGCTGCEYCMPCPQGVKIPRIFRPYDEAAIFGDFTNFFERYRREVGENSCVRCGKCEKACPQHIEIRKHLQKIYEESKA